MTYYDCADCYLAGKGICPLESIADWLREHYDEVHQAWLDCREPIVLSLFNVLKESQEIVFYTGITWAGLIRKFRVSFWRL